MWESGRVVTNDTWLPDDPGGLGAGTAPKTAPAAAWNCPLPSHISLSRLTLVFCIAPEQAQRLHGIPEKRSLSARLPFQPVYGEALRESAAHGCRCARCWAPGQLACSRFALSRILFCCFYKTSLWDGRNGFAKIPGCKVLSSGLTHGLRYLSKVS